MGQAEDTLEQRDRWVGAILASRYRIDRKIGEGGMGAIYAGEHILIKRPVAIKVLHAQFADDPEISARFHQEAQAVNAIGHPHLVEVTDMGRLDDGGTFIVLELLDGQDFARLIESEGPLSIGRAVGILIQVCDAVAAAHEMGIVHRDLKPENIFLTRRGDDCDFVKVLDFGIAKLMDGPDRQNLGMTRTGVVMGTPYYMAPEQAASSRRVDGRADLYSLGVILFYALTGQHPFDDVSYPRLLVKVQTAPPPPVTDYRADIPADLAAVIERLLRKQPEDRFADGRELKQALMAFRSHDAVASLVADATPTRDLAMPKAPVATPAAMSEGSGADSGGPGRQRRGAPWAISALVALVLAAIGVLLSGVVGGAGQDADLADQVTDMAAEDSSGDATTVRVRIDIAPPEAALFLDGQRIANPFDGDLPRADGLHRVEARLDGYRSRSEEVRFTVPQRLGWQLLPWSSDGVAGHDPATVTTSRRSDRGRARRGGQGNTQAAASDAQSESHQRATDPQNVAGSADIQPDGIGASATDQAQPSTDRSGAHLDPPQGSIKRGIRF